MYKAFILFFNLRHTEIETYMESGYTFDNLYDAMKYARDTEIDYRCKYNGKYWIECVVKGGCN